MSRFIPNVTEENSISSDQPHKETLSKEDRIALAKSIEKHDRSKIFSDLTSGDLRPIDFITCTDNSKPLLSYSPIEIAALNQYWALVTSMLEEICLAIDTMNQDEKERAKVTFSKCVLIAAFYRQSTLVKELLSMGADPNKFTSKNAEYNGHGSLHFAIADKSVPTIEDLIDAGADPLLESGNGPSALNYTLNLARYHDAEYWRLIPYFTSPIQSSATGDVKRAYAIVLSYACAYDQTEVAKHLLSAGANPNMVDVKFGALKGYTTLHFAYRNKNKALALYLLKEGADPDVKASDGTTFRSLAYNDNDLTKVLNTNDVQGSAERYLRYYPELVKGTCNRKASLSEQLFDVVGSIRENLFSLFGLTSHTITDRLEKKTDHNQFQTGKHGSQIDSLDSRLNHVESLIDQQQIMSAQTEQPETIGNKLPVTSTTTSSLFGQTRGYRKNSTDQGEGIEDAVEAQTAPQH